MRLELGIAVLSGVVAVGSAMIAYLAEANVTRLENQFQADRELLLTQLTQRHERRQPFLQRQMNHYFEATEAASKIANLEEGPRRTEALEHFWTLYWGPLAVVEDPTVERAMVNFGNALSGNTTRRQLKQLSLELAHACRDSLQKLWDTDLGQLRNLRGAN